MRKCCRSNLNFLYFYDSNLNGFYSTYAKKRDSHGHLKCIKKHEITPQICGLSAIMLCSIYLSYYRLTSTNKFHCGRVEKVWIWISYLIFVLARLKLNISFLCLPQNKFVMIFFIRINLLVTKYFMI